MTTNVLLGVSGGIAAYKACEIAREFVKRGDEVRAVMTDGAREFLRPLTLQVLTENPVGTTTFDATYEHEIGHIDLARWADVVLLAPATANLVARMAAGMGDDLLTTVLLATEAPVVVAPAMNTQMYNHPKVQQNLQHLASLDRHRVVEPDAGELACKEVGPGRLPDPHVLLQAVDTAMQKPLLKNRKVLVTAGPTREHIDPARFVSNPSSGKMGHRVARAARELGADVTLVRGPVSLEQPYGVETLEVTSAAEMHGEVIDRAKGMDYVAMVAAVADWRPADRSADKLKKTELSGTLDLERTPDILAELGARFGPDGEEDGPLLIGFAAESRDIVDRARKKMQRKGAHLMVANTIGGEDGAFGADRTAVTVLDGTTATEYPADSKLKQARAVWQKVVEYGRDS